MAKDLAGLKGKAIYYLKRKENSVDGSRITKGDLWFHLHCFFKQSKSALKTKDLRVKRLGLNHQVYNLLVGWP